MSVIYFLILTKLREINITRYLRRYKLQFFKSSLFLQESSTNIYKSFNNDATSSKWMIMTSHQALRGSIWSTLTSMLQTDSPAGFSTFTSTYDKWCDYYHYAFSKLLPVVLCGPQNASFQVLELM